MVQRFPCFDRVVAAGVLSQAVELFLERFGLFRRDDLLAIERFDLLAEAIDQWPMSGVFPAKAKMLSRRKALGYREIKLSSNCLLGSVGTIRVLINQVKSARSYQKLSNSHQRL